MFAGEAVHIEDFEVSLDRHGHLEEARFAFSYTPVRNDTGSVVGLFGACIETTQQVLAVRQAASRRRNDSADCSSKRPGLSSSCAAPIMSSSSSTTPTAPCSTAKTGPENHPARHFPASRDKVSLNSWIRSINPGKPMRRRGLRFASVAGQDRPEQTRFLTFIYAPLYGDDGSITGIFCEGFDVTDAHSAQRRSRALAKLGELVHDIEDAR